jgi:hypothetical protein
MGRPEEADTLPATKAEATTENMMLWQLLNITSIHTGIGKTVLLIAV